MTLMGAYVLGVGIGLAGGFAAAKYEYRRGLRDGLAIKSTGELPPTLYSSIIQRMTKRNTVNSQGNSSVERT